MNTLAASPQSDHVPTASTNGRLSLLGAQARFGALSLLLVAAFAFGGGSRADAALISGAL